MAHRIKVTGKVEPRGPTITAMTRALPRNLANMRGLKGTCVVFVPTMGAREADQEARITQSKAPFPDKEARGLATIIKKAGKELGICLGRKRDFVTREGRFATELAPMGLKWIDPSSGRLSTLNNPPREAMAAMLRIIPSSTEWKPGAAGKLECHSKLQVSALKDVGKPSPQFAQAAGVTVPPRNEALTCLLGACEKIARAGQIETPQAQRDLQTIGEAAKGADDKIAAVAFKLKDDRGWFEKNIAPLFGLPQFQGHEITTIEGDITAALPRLRAKIEELRLWQKPVREEFRLFFGLTDKATRDRVDRFLTRAESFLAGATRQNFERTFQKFEIIPSLSGAIFRGGTNPPVVAILTLYFKQYSIDRARTQIHEAVHVAGVGDPVGEIYKESACIHLAKTSPTRALSNANNYALFVIREKLSVR